MPRLSTHLTESNSVSPLSRFITEDDKPPRFYQIKINSSYINEENKFVHVNGICFLDELHYLEIALYIAKYICIKEKRKKISIREIHKKINKLFNMKDIIKMRMDPIKTVEYIREIIKGLIKEEKKVKEIKTE